MAIKDIKDNQVTEDKTKNPKDMDSLDKFVSRTQPIGSIERAIGNNLYGINHRRVKGVLPQNKDEQGYLFFTRPQLNLTNENVRNYRKMIPLLNTNADSVHRYVRCLLDPRLHYNNITTPHLDHDMVFMPILTNTLKNNSGWPDVVNTSFISRSGIRREQFAMVDGHVDILESFDLDCTFSNVRDEPTTLIMDTWLHYMSAVFEGRLNPYMDFITENEIDYNTRIYRLILTENKKYVKKIACTGAAYPLNLPTGRFFDYSEERPYTDQTKDISIRFKCLGAIYNDDIIVKWFNEAVGIFNSEMRTLNESCNDKLKRGAIFDRDDPNKGLATGSLEKIPDRLLLLLNFRGYPRINPITMELEWWASKKDVDTLEKEFKVKVMEDELNPKKATT